MGFRYPDRVDRSSRADNTFLSFFPVEVLLQRATGTQTSVVSFVGISLGIGLCKRLDRPKSTDP